MKKLLLGISLLTLSASVFAALPPYHQSVKEIKAILDSEDVASKLGSARAISSIVRDGTNYTVTTADCTLSVQITYVSPPRPDYVGSARFKLHVGEANCLP